MEDLDFFTIKSRAIKAVAALATGTFLLQIITITSQFIISVLLIPSVFGIFAILNAGVSMLNYFSDIGLAAALIQKRESLTSEDLKTSFTIQQLLVVSLVIAGVLSSSFVAQFYKLDISGLWLLRALIFSFLLSSLKTIPTILLERSIQFTKLTFVSIVETVVFYVTIITLALFGYSIESLTIGVLARGITGVVTIYSISSWRPQIGLSIPSAKQLLSFGIPMQANSIIALIKDNLFLLYLGKALTHTEVGYYGWSKSWSEAPLRLVMDSLSKVLFPLYSRLQYDSAQLRSVVEKTLLLQSTLVFPVSVSLLFLIKPIVMLIPKYGKWEGAIPLFYFFVIASVFASIAIPLTHVLNATGRAKKTLSLMTFWTILTWVITPFTISYFGYIGAAIAIAIVNTTQLITIRIIKKIVPFSIMKSIFSPLVASIILGLGLGMISLAVRDLGARIGLMILYAVLVYPACMYFLEYKNLKNDIGFIKQIFKR